MFDPIKIVSLDISKPIKDIENLSGYNKVRILCKWKNNPVCCLTISVVNNICPADLIIKEIETKTNYELIRRLLLISLEHKVKIDGKFLNEIFSEENLNEDNQKPLITVVVCTRDRAEQLKLCLDSLLQLNYPNIDLIVIDNAPSDNSTKDLLLNKYPQFRYVCEPQPGLNWARNRAVLEAKGDIIAFTDDDVVVDKNWVNAISKTFTEEPDTIAITGLVEPYELEEDSHILFEMYGGFGRGYKPKWINIKDNYNKRWQYFITGQFGTGANMAFRRSIFNIIGFFDNALDVGTVTNGGGDLDMFFRVIKFGYTLKYDPNAIVFHRHRNEYQKLKKQFIDHGTGFYSFIIRNFKSFPEERGQILRLCIYHQLFWNASRLLHSFLKPVRFPRELIFAEIIGCFIGLFRYQKAVKNLRTIEDTFGKVNYQVNSLFNYEEETRTERKLFAVRKINLNKELQPINDVKQYQWVRAFVTRDDKLIGSFDYLNNFRNIHINQLKELLINNIWIKIINHDSSKYWETLSGLISGYRNFVTPECIPNTLPKDVSVSIVIATYNRPNDLIACLKSLTEKNYERNVEIVIVDNNPSSGLTPPVIEQYPEVKLVNEHKKGLSFARNAGIRAAAGKIIVTTDDDVVFPDEWLENLLAPFSRNDVAAVTGNTLPFELENDSQLLFERYGGLGKGFEPKEFGPDHFEWYKYLPFPTWDIGATSNAAFRAEIFHNPKIGLFDEALGTGTPTGCSEDTYLFYKILKNGHKIIYEPNAFVWHKHRKTMKALRKQIYNYSKGHIAYHLTTLFKEKDFRALPRILVQIPLYHISRIIKRLLRKSNYTLLLVLIEMLGNLQGPIAYLRSNYRVKKLKREDSKILINNEKIISTNKVETIL